MSSNIDTTLSPEELKILGNKYYSEKKYEYFLYLSMFYSKSLKCYEAAFSQDNTNSTYLFNQASVYMMMKDYDKALEICENILKDFGNTEKVIQRCFKISILQGNYESAYKYYTCVVHNYGESENIKEDKSVLDECNGLCAEIEKCYKNVNKSNGIKSYNCLLQLEEKSPNYPCLFEKKILSLCIYGDLGRSLNLSQTCSNEIERIYYRAFIYYMNNELEKSTKIINSINIEEANNKELQNKINQLKNKINLFSKSIEKAKLLYKEKNYEEALEIYLNALQIDSYNRLINSFLSCNCGVIYLAKKDYHNSYIYFNMSIEYNEENGKSYFGKAETLCYYLCIENLNEAILCYKKSEELLGKNDKTTEKIEKCEKEVKNAKMKNYYDILELNNENNSSNDIDVKNLEKIYKKKAMKWHPDRHSSEIEPEIRYASSQFSAINFAYNVLKDEKKRKDYNGKIQVYNKMKEIKRMNKMIEKVEKSQKERNEKAPFVNSYKYLPIAILVVIYQYIKWFYDSIFTSKNMMLVKEFFSNFKEIPIRILIILYYLICYLFSYIYEKVIYRFYKWISGKGSKKRKNKNNYNEKVDSYWDFSEETENIENLPKLEEFEKCMQKEIEKSMKLNRTERRRREKEEKKKNKKKKD